MTTPTPLTNTIWYGFFTTDLTATLPSSILSTPANLAYEVNNSSKDLGVNTNIYFQTVSVNSDNVDTNLTINIDIASRPNVMTLTNLSSLPFNNTDGTNVYRNNVLINLTKYQYLNSTTGDAITFPPTSFYITLETDNINLTQFIEENKYVPITSYYKSTAIETTLGTVPGSIQIEIGTGNIEPTWVNNTYTIYNPFLPNIYNNYKSLGNNNACGWIIFSTSYD
jgi:hypothetical protein